MAYLGGVAMHIWTIKGYFESLPVELEEAAAVDGATPFQAFSKNVSVRWDDTFLYVEVPEAGLVLDPSCMGLDDAFMARLAGPIAQALAEGKTDPKYHSLTRPWETEAEAVNRAIMLARMTGAPLYIVHMSAKQAVAVLQAVEPWRLDVVVPIRGVRSELEHPARHEDRAGDHLTGRPPLREVGA